MAGHEQSMFVLSGTATLYLDGLGHHELTPDTAAYIASGESYSIENDGPEPLVALVVDAPTPADARHARARQPASSRSTSPRSPTRRPASAARSGCSSTPTSAARGSRSSWARSRSAARPTTATPTTRSSTSSRARASCTWRARRARSAAGSCIYLPPLHMHCLENAGDGPMRVLGVFQPAGSPAARYAEEA